MRDNFFLIKNKFLHIFGSRYIVHFIIIIIAGLVITSNTKANGIKVGATKLIDNNLISKLVKTGEFKDSEQVNELIEEDIEITKVVKKRIDSYLYEKNEAVSYRPRLNIAEENKDYNALLQTSDTISTPSIINTKKAPRQRTKIEYYIVQDGDTVFDIAKKYNITANTIIWENSLNRYGFIKPGQKLTILSTTGITYKVKKYDTIGGIAKKYNIKESDIIKANNITSVSTLQINQKLVIPGARQVSSPVRVAVSTISRYTKSAAVKKTSIKSSTRLLWPASCRVITQYYHWGHHGLDIACKKGTPIYASEDGVIRSSGWASGYGKRITINHGSGMRTLYAHLTKIYVSSGQAVNRGDTIGLMGSTGWSTGPHLHFEVIANGVKKNPLSYIK
ncbi:MAG: peptidoglycan DD-metalloendopeptidase family protein [Patescibacteria group bacterium]|nr:peptidoglycan DD-metalloendopeptidase family protein [Patescibacteria group bacterium]